MKTLIVIPARFGSKRFPGKPLAQLAGKAILQRVWEIAARVCERVPDCSAVVATETPSLECPSRLIIEFCETRKIPVVVTSAACRSGSDRAWEVASLEATTAAGKSDVVVNLQGDVPTCPPEFVVKVVETLRANPDADVATVVTRLSWRALDALREAKKTSPFSGTTAIVDRNGNALWFSKNVIPAIRDEPKRREEAADLDAPSPILRHVGLYGYRFEALKFFAESQKGEYERLEQLEQLRFLENGFRIRTVEGVYPRGYENATSGVDSPEDLARIEEIIDAYGELI